MNLLIQGAALPDLPTILKAINVDATTLLWHLADIDGIAWPPALNNCWMDGAFLIKHWLPQETQLYWGVLDAFAFGEAFEVADPPYSDGSGSLWEGRTLLPQMDGAIFEVFFWDSTAVFLIGLDDGQGEAALRKISGAKRIP